MATRTRIQKTVRKTIKLSLLSSITTNVMLMLMGGAVFAQAEVPEVIRNNPNATVWVSLAGVAIPAFFGWLSKRSETKGAFLTTRANHQTVANQAIVDGLTSERERLLSKVAKLEKMNFTMDEDRDETRTNFYKLQGAVEVLKERVKAKDSRIHSLSLRLADLGHPVTQNPAEDA